LRGSYVIVMTKAIFSGEMPVLPRNPHSFAIPRLLPGESATLCGVSSAMRPSTLSSIARAALPSSRSKKKVSHVSYSL
jgi:hypothetical protein